MQASQMYGTVNNDIILPKPSRKGRPSGALVVRYASVWPLLMSIAAASLIFFLTCSFRSVMIRYESNAMSWVACLVLLIIIFVVGCGQHLSGRLSFALWNAVFLWAAGIVYGGFLYTTFWKPYWDIKNLNTYPSVDPQTYKGQQLMDAGEIEFVSGSRLDLTKSFGFKNEDVYCVAPIVGPKHNNTDTATKHYDFWAIGINCCSGHYSDFHCGEFSNPNAHKGLRLMRDDMRGYFRLAVEEATAAYNIQAPHPVFMYWMQFPSDEVDAYRQDGEKWYINGFLIFLVGWHAFLLICYTMLNCCKSDVPEDSLTVL